MFAAAPARASSLLPGCWRASSSSRSSAGYAMCAAPSVSHASPLSGVKSATIASTPSRLVPYITPAKRSRAFGVARRARA
jgi:hypothetical protein